jgi:hypothetical protein
VTRREVLPLLAAGAVLPPVCMAGPPVPYGEVLDTIRSLAASYLGRKPLEVDTIDSLFRQGMNERQFDAMISDIEAEFRVELSDNQLHQAKWNDPVVGLSVRHLADMVTGRMRSQEPW